MVENTPGRPPLRFHNVCTPCIGARNYQRCGGQRQLQCMFLNAIINFRSQSRRRPNWLPIKISARWESERRSQNSTESEWEREEACLCFSFSHFLVLGSHTYTHTPWSCRPHTCRGYIYTHILTHESCTAWMSWAAMNGELEWGAGACFSQARDPVGIFPALLGVEFAIITACQAVWHMEGFFKSFERKWEKTVGD